MKVRRNCDNCGTEFEYLQSRRKNARFCSRSCLSKLTKQEQDEKRKLMWLSESREQYLSVLSLKYNKFVIKTEGCWDWSSAKNDAGYGYMRHRNQIIKAHRASYMIHKGEIPEGSFVLHSCDHPSCTNPDHLFVGTNTDNMRDMTQKGRNKPRATLTKEQVEDIRKLINLGVPSARIGRDFGVSDVAIHYIKHNKTWKTE